MLALLATAVFLPFAIGEYQPGLCCFPVQMTGFVNVTKGGNTWFMSGARYVVDFDNERAVYLHPTRDDVFILEIGHGDRIGWRYHRNESGYCTREPTLPKEEVYDCLPFDRDIVKRSTDGYGWPLITWKYQEFGSTSDTTVYAGEDCEPYEIRRWIDKPNDTMVYRFYKVFQWEADYNLLHPNTKDCKRIPRQD